jgi:hypothetical protein
LRQVIRQAGRAVVAAALAEAHGIDLEEHAALHRVFIDRAVPADADGEGPLGVRLTLRRPLVAIGAPVGTYYPEVAAGLHTRLCIPPHAEVANAVGAVAGSVTQSAQALITPRAGGRRLRVHWEDGIRDFEDLEAAAAFAAGKARERAQRLAEWAGVSSAQVQVSRRDRTIRAGGQEILLESRIVATAAGRPRLAGDP